jgi:hypothetical protein
MTFASVPPTVARPTLREPVKTLREKGADSFHAALAAVLTAGWRMLCKRVTTRGRSASSIAASRKVVHRWAATSSAGPLRSSGRPGPGPYRSRP